MSDKNFNNRINQAHKEPETDGYISLTIATDKGDIECRFYQTDSESGAIYVGGIGGGFDTPAQGLYPYLSENLKLKGISSLRLRFRNSRSIEESVYDVITGIQFLQKEGISRIGLVGHSLGGAVVIQAAARTKSVKTVVTLATQSYGGDSVKKFPEETSILLIHGNDDSVLPPSCTRTVYELAHMPKKRVFLNGNGHVLKESADKVKEIVYKWLLKELSK